MLTFWKTDPEKNLFELIEYKDFITDVMKISWFGCLAAHLAWLCYVCVVMFSAVYSIFNKVVMGLFIINMPISVWIMKVFGITPGFEISNTVLMLTGIAFGLSMIHKIIVEKYNNVNDRIKAIISNDLMKGLIPVERKDDEDGK